MCTLSLPPPFLTWMNNVFHTHTLKVFCISQNLFHMIGQYLLCTHSVFSIPQTFFTWLDDVGLMIERQEYIYTQDSTTTQKQKLIQIKKNSLRDDQACKYTNIHKIFHIHVLYETFIIFWQSLQANIKHEATNLY